MYYLPASFSPGRAACDAYPVAAQPSTDTSVRKPVRTTDTPSKAIDLQRLHQENREASKELKAPDATYNRTEQAQNLHHQSLLYKLEVIDSEIGECNADLQSQKMSNTPTLSIETRQRLKALQQERKVLWDEMKKSRGEPGSPSPMSTAVPKQKHPGRKSVGDDAYSSSKKVSSSPENLCSHSSDSEDGLVNDRVKLIPDDNEAQESEKSRRRWPGKPSSPDGASSSDESKDTILDDSERNEDVASTPLSHSSAGVREYLVEGDSPATDNKLSSLVRTVTTRRLKQSTLSPSVRKLPQNEQLNNLTQIHESGKSLSVQMPEDRWPSSSDSGSNKLDVLERKMEKLAAQGDAAASKYHKLKQAIARDHENGDVGPQTMAAKQRKLQQYKNEYRQYSNKVASLIPQWETLVEHASPPATRSAKQLADDRKSFINQYKSGETRTLEKTYDDLLAGQQKRIEGDFPYVSAWDAAAGAAGFASSFLIGNTLSRYLPGWLSGHWSAYLIPPAISGGLHVVVATPIVKNLMARTWSATSLAELNNYFKLGGAYVGDLVRGKADVQKYDSKNTDETEKLNIRQRWAQEKGIRELTANRYQDEEAAYWMYTTTYAVKAMLFSAYSQHLSPGTDAIKHLEAAFHGAMGMASGAGYVPLQQLARSLRPGAKPTAVPTREIFAAQADFLKSLRDDLSAALQEHRENQGSNPTDPTERALRKEIHRIDNERKVADDKAQWAGIARSELTAQFQGEAFWDTMAEIFGRIISLWPTTAVSYLTASMRKSPDPMMMFLGHFLPAVTLMFPIGVGGFTSRPWICGVIRAGMQAFLVGRFTSRPSMWGVIRAGMQAYLNCKEPQTVATQVPAAVRTRGTVSQQNPADESSSKTRASDLSSTSIHRSDLSSSDVSSGEISADEAAVIDIPDDSAIVEASEEIIDIPDDSSIVEASEEIWTGNPTQRDENAAN